MLHAESTTAGFLRQQEDYKIHIKAAKEIHKSIKLVEGNDEADAKIIADVDKIRQTALDLIVSYLQP